MNAQSITKLRIYQTVRIINLPDSIGFPSNQLGKIVGIDATSETPTVELSLVEETDGKEYTSSFSLDQIIIIREGRTN